MAGNNNRVVVVGSCMVDFVSYTPRLPKAGETIHGTEFATNFGGKGANQCVAVAKLGGNTAMVARVGTDVWGDKYIENLNGLGVDTTYVKKTENFNSGVAQILVAESGENQIVIVAGANTQLSKNDVDEASKLISDAAVVVLQLETPVDVALKTLDIAQGITILNGAPALATYDPELLKKPTIFCVNETECSIFTGLPITNKGEAEAAAHCLLNKGCNSVLITLGSQGAIFIDQKTKEFIHINSPQVKAVDTTGAGDAFIGALAFVLANNKTVTMETAINAACIAAADSVTRYGTQKSFPTADVLKKCSINV